MKLTLTSPRSRREQLAAIPAPDGCKAPVLRLTGSGGSTLLAERDPLSAIYHAILPSMEAGEASTWDAAADEDAAAENAADDAADEDVAPRCGIEHVCREDRVEVSLGESPFMTFHHGAGYPKPFINPILTPGGVNMLREPLPAYSEGEHPWQRGLTLMQGAINGVDCWGEFDRPGFGRTVQDEMSIHRGPLSLTIATGNTWYEGERPLMSDRRWYRLFDTGRDAVVLDVLFTLVADRGPVTIGSTKEGGFLSIRVNPSMNASGNGRMRNVYGADDETGCWSRRAHWMDYCGPVGDETAGFAVFDHPDNLRYPTAWHVRGYGLFAANCWMVWDDHHCAADTETTFRWRVVIHGGDSHEAAIADRYLDYVDGPRTAWED